MTCRAGLQPLHSQHHAMNLDAQHVQTSQHLENQHAQQQDHSSWAYSAPGASEAVAVAADRSGAGMSVAVAAVAAELAAAGGAVVAPVAAESVCRSCACQTRLYLPCRYGTVLDGSTDDSAPAPAAGPCQKHHGCSDCRRHENPTDPLVQAHAQSIR